MKEYFKSPFFNVYNDKLIYLKKIEICDLPKEEKIRDQILKNEGALLYKKNKENINIKERVLVVEPHPDDFALSAFGYIDDTSEVTVLNVFASMNTNSFTWHDKLEILPDEYTKLRIAEDKIAISQILNYKYYSLNEKSIKIADCNFEGIEKNIANKANKIINENNISILMIPMAIGKHPDHIIVYNAITNILLENLSKEIKIIFYPEYPYARCKKMYNDRLLEVQNIFDVAEIVKDIDNEKLEDIANIVSAYRSQYDDINHSQMLAIIREDCRAIANEYKRNDMALVYFELKR